MAALLDGPRDFEGPVVAVLSGGNIDPLLMMRVIRHGLVAQGRYLACSAGSRTVPVGWSSCSPS